MHKPRILVSWIGHNDLLAMAESVNDERMSAAVSKIEMRIPQKPVGDGPIRSLLRHHKFCQVHLLSDFQTEINTGYAKWIGCNPVIHGGAAFSDPTSYREVYEFASHVLELVYQKDASLCLYLSSGTSTMRAVWVLLGKTLFPAIFYKERKGQVTEETIPFDITIDIVPELLRMQDSQLQSLASWTSEKIQGFQDIIGDSQALKYAIGLAQRAAIRDVNVLLTGESGTGKELFARAMHNASHRGRSGKPFYAMNCAAIPQSLFESELFGTAKGAYTGAVNRSGAFELAAGGTLFLDEVGELSSDNQAKLLRVIQSRSNGHPCDRWVRPLGAKDEIKLDVRVIAATNRDLESLVTAGGFRDDLYYRLAVVSVRLPSLRQRRTDIETLSKHLLDKINTDFQATEKTYKPKTLSHSAIRSLRRHHWPGNIRELNGLLTQLSVFSDSTEITAEEIDSALQPTCRPAKENLLFRQLNEQIDLRVRLKEIETHFINEALHESGGSQTKAARLLGVSQQCLSIKLKGLNYPTH